MKRKYSLLENLGSLVSGKKNLAQLQSGDTRRVGGAPAQYIGVEFLKAIPGATVTSEPTSGHGADVSVTLDGFTEPFKVEAKSGGATFDVTRGENVGDWLVNNEDALLLMNGDLESYKFIIWDNDLATAVSDLGLDCRILSDEDMTDFKSWIDTNCRLLSGGRSSATTQEYNIPVSLGTSARYANNLPGATITEPNESTIQLAIQQTVQAAICVPDQETRARGLIQILSDLSVSPPGIDYTKLRTVQTSMVGRHSCFPLVEVKVKSMSTPLLHKVFAVQDNFVSSVPEDATIHESSATIGTDKSVFRDPAHWIKGTVGTTTVYAKMSAFRSGTSSSNTPDKVFKRALGAIEVLEYVKEKWSAIWRAYNDAKTNNQIVTLSSSGITAATNATATPASSTPPVDPAVQTADQNVQDETTQDEVLETLGGYVMRTLQAIGDQTGDEMITAAETMQEDWLTSYWKKFLKDGHGTWQGLGSTAGWKVTVPTARINNVSAYNLGRHTATRKWAILIMARKIEATFTKGGNNKRCPVEQSSEVLPTNSNTNSLQMTKKELIDGIKQQLQGQGARQRSQLCRDAIRRVTSNQTNKSLSSMNRAQLVVCYDYFVGGGRTMVERKIRKNKNKYSLRILLSEMNDLETVPTPDNFDLNLDLLSLIVQDARDAERVSMLSDFLEPDKSISTSLDSDTSSTSLADNLL